MNKHAYLVMAHNNFEILEKTLKLLDDEKNDFYVHIDKKVKNFDFEKLKNFIKKSKIFFTDRINVKWGDFSQIQCELILLKEATRNKYSYYHLISGVDMPIKSKDEIYNFFENNKGKEFVHFVKEKPKNIKNRYSYYHLFPSSSRSNLKYFLKLIDRVIFLLQMILRIDRIKNQNIKFGFGAQWFSITDSFAKYVLEKENWIKNTFKFTSCCDEIFLQTLLMNSPYNIYIYISYDDLDNYIYNLKRYIDWNRGIPYTFRKEDFNDLINSKALFARKFDLSVDKKIVDMIFNYFINK